MGEKEKSIMVEKYVFEGKTEEELLPLAEEKLDTNAEELYYQFKEVESGKLFKSKKHQIEVYQRKDVISYIKNFLKELSEKMDLPIQTEIRVENENIQVQLYSDNNAILIGKEGRTMNALQTILKQTIQNQIDYPLHIHLDVSNYRAKQEHNFEYEIKKLMKEVQKTKMDMKLEPMNSYQRRMIHNLSNQFDHITTFSTGEGKDRYITIHYEEE